MSTDAEKLAQITAWAEDMEGGEPVFLDRLRAVLRGAGSGRPTPRHRPRHEGVVLSRDEAAHAAWAIRQAKGWPKEEPDVIGWAEYNRALAARLEASS